MRLANFAAVAALVALALAPAPALADAAADAADADLVVIDSGLAQISLTGLLQTQIAPYVGDDAFVTNGDPAQEPGARIRRARLGFAGTVYGDTDFSLSLEATPGGVELLSAWVAWRGPADLSVYGGARRVPFSRFALVGAGRGALVDRPLAVRAMAPFRQVGLTVEGEVADGLFGWAVGAYNGFMRSTNFHQGYGEAAALEGNQFTNLAYAARLDLELLGPMGDGLADLDQGPARFGIGAAFYYDDGKTVQTMGAEADLLLQIAGFHLAAELLWDSSEPAEQPTTTEAIPTAITRMSMVAEAGYVILPERLGATVRVELIDDDTELDDSGDQLIVTGGVQCYFRRHHLKAGLEFTHRSELEGLALDNDSLLAQLQLEL